MQGKTGIEGGGEGGPWRDRATRSETASVVPSETPLPCRSTAARKREAEVDLNMVAERERGRGRETGGWKEVGGGGEERCREVCCCEDLYNSFLVSVWRVEDSVLKGGGRTGIIRAGADVACFAPSKPQMHAVNHLTGEEEPQTRDVLAESARIARGRNFNKASKAGIEDRWG